MQHNGQTIDALVHPARDGYLWVLQQTDNGIKFISGQPFVYQNAFKSLDPQTGRPTYDPEHKPVSRQGDQLLSVAVGRRGLAVGIVQRPDAAAVHPRQRQHVRQDARREEAAHRRPALARRRSRQPEAAAARRSYRRTAGLGSGDRQAGLDLSVPEPAVRVGAEHGRRAGVRRRHQRPHVPRVRCQDRRAAVAAEDQLRDHRHAGRLLRSATPSTSRSSPVGAWTPSASRIRWPRPR